MRVRPLLAPCGMFMLLATLCYAQPGFTPAGLMFTPPASTDVEEHPSFLDKLADQPGRPTWAMVPVLQGRFDLVPSITRGLQQKDPVLQRRALFLVACLRSPKLAALARPALKSRVTLVRRQAAVTLCLLGDQRGGEGAVAVLREGPDWLRFYAVQGLWQVRATEALRHARASQSAFLQATIDQALQTLSRPLPEPARVGTYVTPPDLYHLWIALGNEFVTEADYWWHRGDYEQCIRCQETTLFFDPANTEAFENIAWLQWSLGRQEQAIATYKRDIAANPQSWEAAYALGRFYFGQKQLNLAIPYLQRAAELGSPAVPSRTLGHALEAAGRTTEAIKAWRRILTLDPTDPIAQRQLQRLEAQ